MINSRPLASNDVITEGWVIRARSVELEDVDVEIVLPGLKEKSDPYQAGDKITLDKKNTFAAALHVQKFDHDRLCVTLMPITYQGLGAKDGKALKMNPPALLNMEAYWPISNDPANGEKVAVQGGE